MGDQKTGAMPDPTVPPHGTSATDARPSVSAIAMTAQDGLRLRGQHYQPASGVRPSEHRRPVVCLAGLTRNGRDFTALATALASGDDARDVYTFDMRGRGQSDFAKDWKTYTIRTELNDAIDLMTAFGLFNVALIGTSRGGLLGMGLLALQPTRIGALVLNDIGPVIDLDGLLRIAGYVGTVPTPETWDDARAIVKRGNIAHFPNVGDDEWDAVARQWFNARDDGSPMAGYDTQLAKTFVVPAGGLPELWPQFEAATRVPCLTIRGGNSDLLSAATVERMASRHPNFSSHTVRDQGHAPLLRDAPTISTIQAFLKQVG